MDENSVAAIAGAIVNAVHEELSSAAQPPASPLNDASSSTSFGHSTRRVPPVILFTAHQPPASPPNDASSSTSFGHSTSFKILSTKPHCSSRTVLWEILYYVKI